MEKIIVQGKNGSSWIKNPSLFNFVVDSDGVDGNAVLAGVEDVGGIDDGDRGFGLPWQRMFRSW